MSTSAVFVSAFAGLMAVAVIVVYFVGIPAAWKRAAEEAALEKMGENKLSYAVKDQISKVPESNQQDVDDLRKGVSNAVGGGLQNPIGKEGGNIADEVTSPFTGREH